MTRPRAGESPRSSSQGFERFPESFLQELLARAEIVDVVGSVVQLKKSGSNYFGLCPFHGEKSPSFSVTPSKQFYHCFGCGKNGNALGFVMEHGGLSFREAVEDLARSVGMPLPRQQPEAAAAEARKQQEMASLVATNERAADFFRQCLEQTDKPRDYLSGRGVPGAASSTFVLGYAPAGWHALKQAFGDYGTNQHLVDSGLVIDKDGRRYDRFRDRLMFGIRDARGRLVGFGGRELDGSDVKYINSPESVAFDKSSALFGLYEAREPIRKAGRVIVTEGYMDTIAHAMHGLGETVGTMGTACTSRHLERLMALAQTIVFAFDGDAAGRKAAWRALDVLLPMVDDEHVFKFLILPDGFDPDELLLEEGESAYRARVDAALSLSQFLITRLAERHGSLATADDRAHFVRDGMQVIGKLPQGTRLYRFLRQEISAASALSGPAISALTRNADRRTTAQSSRFWDTLTKAVDSQPATAARFADRAVEGLTPQLQEAFFAGELDHFGSEERPFWNALRSACSAASPVDKDGELAIAQRDLLAQCDTMIAHQRVKASRADTLAAFRRGEATTEQLLGGERRGPKERSTA